MSHAETKQQLDNFKTSTFTDAAGKTFTAVQISSTLGKLSDKERTLRKQAEADKKTADLQAENDRLKSLLEGKTAKKTA